MIPTLTTARLTLRGFTADDWPAYRGFYASDATRHIGGPRSEAGAWRLFAADVGHWHLKGYGWFAIDDGTGIVGATGLHHPPHHADVEIGWNLFCPGRGYGTEAAAAALAWGWQTVAPTRIVSYIDEHNAASKRVAQKLGAVPERARALHDPACEVWVHTRPA